MSMKETPPAADAPPAPMKAEVAVKQKKPSKPLNPRSQAIRENVLTGLKGNSADGVGVETKSNFIDNMPEGITPESDAEHSSYRSDFVAGSLAASGDIAMEMLKANKKLATVTVELAMGTDSVNHSITREKPYTKFGESEPSGVKFGHTRTDVDIKGGHNSGQLKIARGIVAELITDLMTSGSGKKK